MRRVLYFFTFFLFTAVLVVFFCIKRIFFSENLSSLRKNHVNLIVLGGSKTKISQRINTLNLFSNEIDKQIIFLAGERYLINLECKKNRRICGDYLQNFTEEYFKLKDNKKREMQNLTETEATVLSVDENNKLRNRKIFVIQNNKLKNILQYFLIEKNINNKFVIQKLTFNSFKKLFFKEKNSVLILDDKKKEVAFSGEERPTTKTTILFLNQILNNNELPLNKRESIFISDQPFARRQFLEIQKYLITKNCSEIHESFFTKCKDDNMKKKFILKPINICYHDEILNLNHLNYLKNEIIKYLNILIK